jgi:Tfp pilus assembly protein PilN
MGIDMKKEIKLSDLFKRGEKEPKADKPPKAEKPPKEPKRKKEPKAPKEPKERRFGRGKAPKVKVAALDPKSGPPVRDIPLMHSFNLLPKEEVRAEREGRASAIPHIVVALAGVLVFAALAAFYLSSSASVTNKTGDLDDLRGELAGLQVPEQQPQQPTGSGDANIEGERTARTAALSAALQDRLAWDRILRELALVLPSDVTLDTLDATAPSPGSAAAGTSSAVSSFRVTGRSISQAGVARLLSRLQVIPELSSVTLEYATASEDTTKPGVNFSITAGVRQGAAA